jgi:hypothetical protein
MPPFPSARFFPESAMTTPAALAPGGLALISTGD